MGEPKRASVPTDDPVWAAAMAAPLDLTPDSEEEREAIEYVRRHGLRGVAGEIVTAEIEARRQHEG